MRNTLRKRNEQGFTLAELLVSSVVFLLLAGASFSLLATSSKRFKTDSQVLTSFQEARLGIDQISRDIADGGFPPHNHFNNLNAVTPVTSYAATPFAWAPGYPATCTVGGSCTVSPTGFDLIIETDYDGTGVKWIRYQLPAGTTTLLRAVVPKTAGDPDPATSGAGVLLPYIQNVMNNASGAQIAAIRAVYPNMFPGGNPVPVFTYTLFDTPSSALVGGCASVATSPCTIRDIDIVLIVQAPNRDAQTERLRLVELHGLGHRLNPNQ
jgi:prepilin-type N-terminal cleavage/methylation domain-containing protein